MSDAAVPRHTFSFGRVLLLAVPLALVLWGAYKIYGGSFHQEEQAAVARGQRNSFVGLFGGEPEAAPLDSTYKDADGDLLADSPADDECIDPEELNFSYVASSAVDGEEATWKELLAAFKDKLGRPVNLKSYADADEQIRALKRGDLHITAFSTGEAPSAVNEAGFLPLVCVADQNGDYRITMKVIVPADSKIQKVDDLKGRRMTFVRPRSNSGCTAALVMLWEKHDLQPERDYTWGFSFGHDNSIEGVAEKRFEAAAVASDILDRMVADGRVSEDAIRTIYESEPFPPGVIGCAYNLKSDVRKEIQDALISFVWDGTGIEKEFGPQGAVKFAVVSYDKDWEPVRDIRQAGAEMFAQLSAP